MIIIIRIYPNEFFRSSILHMGIIVKEKVITKMHTSDQSPNLCLDLLLQDVLEGDGVSGELGDTLTQLLDGHGLLVEFEAEESLVVDVGLLGDVEAGGVGGVELLGDGSGGVEEVLEEVGLDHVNSCTRYRE